MQRPATLADTISAKTCEAHSRDHGRRRPKSAQAGTSTAASKSFFTAIRIEIAKRPYRIEIDYDPDLGYPRMFYIKRFENAVDDWYTFTVEAFTVLAK